MGNGDERSSSDGRYDETRRSVYGHEDLRILRSRVLQSIKVSHIDRKVVLGATHHQLSAKREEGGDVLCWEDGRSLLRRVHYRLGSSRTSCRASLGLSSRISTGRDVGNEEDVPLALLWVANTSRVVVRTDWYISSKLTPS
jgi:hypothetical protein